LFTGVGRSWLLIVTRDHTLFYTQVRVSRAIALARARSWTPSASIRGAPSNTYASYWNRPVAFSVTTCRDSRPSLCQIVPAACDAPHHTPRAGTESVFPALDNKREPE